MAANDPEMGPPVVPEGVEQEKLPAKPPPAEKLVVSMVLLPDTLPVQDAFEPFATLENVRSEIITVIVHSGTLKLTLPPELGITTLRSNTTAKPFPVNWPLTRHVTSTLTRLNIAVTLILSVISTTHAPVPEHAPPQPMKTEPLFAIAESVTSVPRRMAPEQLLTPSP